MEGRTHEIMSTIPLIIIIIMSSAGLRSVGGTAAVSPVYSKALHYGDRYLK